MKTADVFKVVNNITLAFESRNKQYTMRLLVENGLIILSDSKGKDTIIFLGDEGEGYTGSPVETEPVVSTEIKPKKKRKSKKKIQT